jgi:hypothetical protein
MPDFYAVSPSSGSSLSIGQYVNGYTSNAVLFTDSSGLLAQSSRFTWAADILNFSSRGRIYQISDDIYLEHTGNGSYIQIQSDGNMTFHSDTFGSFTLEAIAADLVQISGPYIVNNVGSVLVDYSGVGLILQYASLDIAWDLEGGYINRPNGTLFVDMTFDYMGDSNGIVFFDILQRIFSDETGANSIVFGSAGIEMYNKVIRYDSVFTAGVGMPAILYEYATTGLTAAANNNLTTAAPAGWYRVTCSVQITSAWTTGTMSATIAWNNGAAKTKVLFSGLAMNAVNSEDGGRAEFIVAASTTINISTTFTAPTGSGTYKIKTIIEKIGSN